jgi:hypothetical protein
MEKLRITLELTLEEARFVISKLWQFRAAKEVANKQQPQPEPEPQPFMLQYGKRYRRRDGEITKPLMESDSEVYPFTDGSKTWASDGAFHYKKFNHPYDLIEEA